MKICGATGFYSARQECDEKFAAARHVLAAAGVELPAAEAAETTEACSDGACKIIEWGDSRAGGGRDFQLRGAALGRLRHDQERRPARRRRNRAGAVHHGVCHGPRRAALRQKFGRRCLDVGKQAELKAALETLKGFVAIDDDQSRRPDAQSASGAAGKRARQAASPNRDEGNLQLARLARPESRRPRRLLPADAAHRSRRSSGGSRCTAPAWAASRPPRSTSSSATATSATRSMSSAATRRPTASRCGPSNIRRPASSITTTRPAPRRSFTASRAYLLGAFGDLTCVELRDGHHDLAHEPHRAVRRRSGARVGHLFVAADRRRKADRQSGRAGGLGRRARSRDGEVIWQSPGERHAYSSFIVATLGGVRQLVGYDRSSLGGWEIATGRRLWTLKPPHDGDFNVPTPVAVDGRSARGDREQLRPAVRFRRRRPNRFAARCRSTNDSRRI